MVAFNEDNNDQDMDELESGHNLKTVDGPHESDETSSNSIEVLGIDVCFLF
jgi:hypothetical protein